MLNLILDQVKSIIHHLMIDVFKHSANVLELEEGKSDEQEASKYKDDIQMNLELLSDWANGITRHDNIYDNFLAPIEGPEVKDLRVMARLIERWLRQDKTRQVNQSYQLLNEMRLAQFHCYNG